MNHMHTIRLMGNRAGHVATGDSVPIQVTDVYPSVTSLVALLEWWHAQPETLG